MKGHIRGLADVKKTVLMITPLHPTTTLTIVVSDHKNRFAVTSFVSTIVLLNILFQLLAIMALWSSNGEDQAAMPNPPDEVEIHDQ